MTGDEVKKIEKNNYSRGKHKNRPKSRDSFVLCISTGFAPNALKRWNSQYWLRQLKHLGGLSGFVGGNTEMGSP
jgi:hypothetical protein